MNEGREEEGKALQKSVCAKLYEVEGQIIIIIREKGKAYQGNNYTEEWFV